MLESLTDFPADWSKTFVLAPDWGRCPSPTRVVGRAAMQRRWALGSDDHALGGGDHSTWL